MRPLLQLRLSYNHAANAAHFSYKNFLRRYEHGRIQLRSCGPPAAVPELRIPVAGGSQGRIPRLFIAPAPYRTSKHQYPS
jgi:hypothetical protein